MEFRCRLGTPGGDIVEGVYAAESEARLRHELEEKGLYVLAIQRAGHVAFGSLKMPSRARISTREFLVFNQELATLLKAGMPLVQSLEILRQRVTNPLLKAVLDDVHERVRGGSSLSEAFEAHGTMFPGVYTASLLAGEKSGSLEQVIRRYVAYVKVVSGVKRKTISALVYPLILLVLSCIVVGIIVLRVVPEFAAFYNQFGEELPLSTRIIVAFSTFAGTYFFLVLFGVVAVGVAFWTWLKRPGNQRRFDRWTLRIPLLGAIAQKFATSQAARTLATLLGGGIPLVNAIDVSARSIANQHMAHELQTGGAAGAGRARAGDRVERERRVSGRRHQDGRGRRVDRRAAGNAQQPGGLLRRGDRDEPRPVRHDGRAGAARGHGARDRRAAALALHAAVQPVVRAVVARTLVASRLRGGS